MIPNGERWHYFTVKIISAFLRRITSKHDGDFYCLNRLHSFTTESKLEFHKKYLKIKTFLVCKAFYRN